MQNLARNQQDDPSRMTDWGQKDAATKILLIPIFFDPPTARTLVEETFPRVSGGNSVGRYDSCREGLGSPIATGKRAELHNIQPYAPPLCDHPFSEDQRLKHGAMSSKGKPKGHPRH